MPAAESLAIKHLLLKLRPLNRILREAVRQQREAATRFAHPEVHALCVTDEQVEVLLSDVDDLVRGSECGASSAEPAPDEAKREASLRANAPLPLDRLAKVLRLSAFEQEAVLLCAAPEVDRSYERIYAYIVDDLNRRFPSVELLSSLTASSLDVRLVRRRLLGAAAKLRRHRVLEPFGESSTGMRQQLRLAPLVLDFLLGGQGDIAALCRERAEVDLPEHLQLPQEFEPERIRQLGHAMRKRDVTAVGFWGAGAGVQDDVVPALALAAGKPLRVLRLAEVRNQSDAERCIREAIYIAAAEGAILWIPTDAWSEPDAVALSETLVDVLASSTVCTCLSGLHPWRPTSVLAAHAYAELELPAPSYRARKAMWTSVLPEADEQHIADLAARFRLSASELRAVASVARTGMALSDNGNPSPIDERVEAACAAVIHKRTGRFARIIKPNRSPEDLVLPENLHAQVMEVAQFFRAWPRVAEAWGFAKKQTGGRGLKALFTGDPGTGKTLSAEVIASELKVPLLAVDLGRVVSKWVGETEKNLESAFREAEESHSVLFFDEAEALFGKRSEVQHGTDRYANLEVSYLLQRLEDYDGLVVLASNLKDQIDPAFSRRFQIILHFPRPTEVERRRIWEISFPDEAPLDGSVDLDALARLDLTGAGIVSVARTAALLAAQEESEKITMRHLIRSTTRQFRREARVLTTASLGRHAALIDESSP